MSSKLTETQNVVIGTGASFCQAVILQPTIFWKNAAQQGLAFTMNPRIVYRGMGAALVNESGQMGLQFGTAGFLKKIFGDSKFGVLASALLAGSFMAPFVQCCEMTMIQQQRFGGTLFSTALRVHREYGIFRGIFRGFSPLVCRETLYTGGLLGTTPLLQDFLIRRHGWKSSTGEIAAALTSGVVVGILSCPFDAMSTSMKGDVAQQTYGGFCDTLHHRMAGGPSVVFGGALWRSVNVAGTILIANAVLQRVEPLVVEYNIRQDAATRSQ